MEINSGKNVDVNAFIWIKQEESQSWLQHPKSVIDVKYNISCLAQTWRLLHPLQKGSVCLLSMDSLPICMTSLVRPPLLSLLFFILIHCAPPKHERQYFHFPVLATPTPHFWPITWIVSDTSSTWWMFEELPTWSENTFLTSCRVGWSLQQTIVMLALDHLVTCL